MVVINGIPNCDTMKKARKWLDAQGVEYRFHDFKKHGLDREMLLEWNRKVGWETLLNRRGMMWRKLSDEVKANIDEASAIEIMLETPTIIKRPVVDISGSLHVGFSETRYGELFRRGSLEDN
ncbi:MAG: ArsC family reductase [Candidatus Sedimenticola sp. (ex Thyasira tokunagai)]